MLSQTEIAIRHTTCIDFLRIIKISDKIFLDKCKYVAVAYIDDDCQFNRTIEREIEGLDKVLNRKELFEQYFRIYTSQMC